MSEVYVRQDDGWPLFRITPEATGFEDVSFQASVDAVTGVDLDGAPVDFEPYLRCGIKWDSCCHFWFGDPAEKDGYLHLCGAAALKNHALLLKKLYEMAFEAMGREPEPDERW